jgi:diguanylate cyclase (GGDEF)-like protein
MDVDGLKEINDTLGHSFGSAVLLHAARALEQCKRISDVASRWGGDEFALLMPGAREDAAARLSEDILARLRAEPLRAEGRERRVSVTIGIAACVGEPGEDLFDAADRALYEAKRAGKGRVAIAG